MGRCPQEEHRLSSLSGLGVAPIGTPPPPVAPGSSKDTWVSHGPEAQRRFSQDLSSWEEQQADFTLVGTEAPL